MIVDVFCTFSNDMAFLMFQRLKLRRCTQLCSEQKVSSSLLRSYHDPQKLEGECRITNQVRKWTNRGSTIPLSHLSRCGSGKHQSSLLTSVECLVHSVAIELLFGVFRQGTKMSCAMRNEITPTVTVKLSNGGVPTETRKSMERFSTPCSCRLPGCN